MNRLVQRFLPISICGAVAFTCLAMSAQSNDSKPSAKKSAPLNATDTKFVREAADGGMAEVELGQLAVSKGSSDDVKKFGQRMIDDHGKANDQLKQLASEKNIELPQEPNANCNATKARLEKLSGSQFDQAYMADMLKDHKKDVANFTRASKSAQDPDIKNFAAQTLPTLQDHLKQAQTVTPSKGTGHGSTIPNNSPTNSSTPASPDPPQRQPQN